METSIGQNTKFLQKINSRRSGQEGQVRRSFDHPTGTPKSQLFTKQLLMRPEEEQEMFSITKDRKEGATMRQAGGVEMLYSQDPYPWVGSPQMGG